MVRVAGRVRLTRKNTSWVTGQPVFASGQKNRVRVGYFWVGSKSSVPFCHVYSEDNYRVRTETGGQSRYSN